MVDITARTAYSVHGPLWATDSVSDPCCGVEPKPHSARHGATPIGECNVPVVEGAGWLLWMEGWRGRWGMYSVLYSVRKSCYFAVLLYCCTAVLYCRIAIFVRLYLLHSCIAVLRYCGIAV